MQGQQCMSCVCNAREMRTGAHYVCSRRVCQRRQCMCGLCMSSCNAMHARRVSSTAHAMLCCMLWVLMSAGMSTTAAGGLTGLPSGYDGAMYVRWCMSTMQVCMRVRWCRCHVMSTCATGQHRCKCQGGLWDVPSTMSCMSACMGLRRRRRMSAGVRLVDVERKGRCRCYGLGLSGCSNARTAQGASERAGRGESRGGGQGRPGPTGARASGARRDVRMGGCHVHVMRDSYGCAGVVRGNVRACQVTMMHAMLAWAGYGYVGLCQMTVRCGTICQVMSMSGVMRVAITMIGNDAWCMSRAYGVCRVYACRHVSHVTASRYAVLYVINACNTGCA